MRERLPPTRRGYDTGRERASVIPNAIRGGVTVEPDARDGVEIAGRGGRMILTA
jgi:hypothetical protein